MKIDTLHICNYSEVINKSFYAELINSNDCIVVFSQHMTIKQHQELLDLLTGTCENLNFIIEDDPHNISTINHQHWLQFTNEAHRIFTWK